jgi:hypothetical protein
VAAGHRIWTPPYAFFENHYTGVTRTTPVYRTVTGDPQLHAVLTIDFDVAELSRLVGTGVLAGTRTLLFTKDGTLLAFPEGASRIAALPFQLDHPLSFRELEDPVLDAFFGDHEHPADGPERFRAGTDEYLAIVLFTCLAKEPRDRPQTMRELLEDLTRIERELAAGALWTEARAAAWWREHMPASAPAETATPSGSAQYLQVVPDPWRT